MNMRRFALAAAMAAATLSGVAQAQAPEDIYRTCIEARLDYQNNKLEPAIEKARACLKDGKDYPLDWAMAHLTIVYAQEKLGRKDEVIAELRKLTAPPYAGMKEFVPPTLAMDKLKEKDTYTGFSQPRLIRDLAIALAEQGKLDEALAETARGLKTAATVRADLLEDEADLWYARAAILQEKGDSDGVMAALARAYIRGSKSQEVVANIEAQPDAVLAKLKELRATMTEHAAKVAYQNAWQASLGKPFDPADPAIAASVKAVAQVIADEEAMAGPPGL